MTTTHIFTEAGLGKAPFAFAGFEQKPGGSGCHFCGTAIKNLFHVESADGRRFAVGSECVHKSGDQGLIEIAKAERNRIRREAAQAKRQAKIDADHAAQRARNGGLTDWEQQEADWAAEQAAELEVRQPVIELVTAIADDLEDGRGGWRDSVARDLRDGHLPTPNACDIVVDILAKQAGRRNTDAHKAEADRVEAVLAKAAESV